MAGAEPDGCCLLVRQPRELLEVRRFRQRSPELGIELAIDLEPDRLVLGERAVEVEEDGACQRVTERA
jgi:hypothetical protein